MLLILMWDIRTDDEQEEIELLSLWSVGRLSFAMAKNMYKEKEDFNITELILELEFLLFHVLLQLPVVSVVNVVVTSISL